MNVDETRGLEIIAHFYEEIPTIPRMFYNTVNNAGDNPANLYKKGKEWKTVSYKEWADISEEIAYALMFHGVKKSDNICIMSRLSAQRGWADIAIQLCGAVTATVEPLVSDEDLTYIINYSDVKFIFVESPRTIERIKTLWTGMYSLKGIICLQEDYKGDNEKTWGLQQFRETGREYKKLQPAKLLAECLVGLSGVDLARINYRLDSIGELRSSYMKQGNWLGEDSEQRCRVLEENMNSKLTDVLQSLVQIPGTHERTFSFLAMIATGSLIKYGHGPFELQNVNNIYYNCYKN